ncbi:thioredoxin-2 isoform X2 [Athalia rosae]|uniref:thioredoxin-2 isoform X2 n=1 Tax=Athalia rosae TaxID=37344 RepID=UPI000A0EE1B4|nr:thioredoxin-2 isoform X2 [Athalia rosae]
MVLKISNNADLKAKLAEAGSTLVVIDFFATWCGPCKMIGPKLEELSQELKDIIILKVDVDECEDIAFEYEISSMPTFVFIKNGAVVKSFAGANFDKLKATIQELKEGTETEKEQEKETVTETETESNLE